MVNMSSAAGRFGYAFRTPYAAAKWGVIGLTQSLAKELGPHGITRQRHPARHRRGPAHGGRDPRPRQGARRRLRGDGAALPGARLAAADGEPARHRRTWSCSWPRRWAATSPGSRSASTATSRHCEGTSDVTTDPTAPPEPDDEFDEFLRRRMEQEHETPRSQQTAIVGTGLVGRAWAIAFARAGHVVSALGSGRRGRRRLRGGVRRPDPGPRGAGHAGRRRIRPRCWTACGPSSRLRDALDGVGWVQESAPERLEVKRELWELLDHYAEAEVILASSTSAIVPSQFTEHIKGRHRCLVVPPAQPALPHPGLRAGAGALDGARGHGARRRGHARRSARRRS